MQHGRGCRAAKQGKNNSELHKHSLIAQEQWTMDFTHAAEDGDSKNQVDTV
jgi:hypothetical protein